jgi:hypothetical protein
MPLDRRSLRRPAVAVMLALLAAAGPIGGASRAATFTVTGTSWGTTTTAGTLAWAIDQANGSSDTGNVISIKPNLLIDVDDATAIDVALDLAQITRSVTIEGNGATLVGNPEFITRSAQPKTVTKYNPEAFVSGDVQVTPSFSFAKIGTSGRDNSGITVSITGLNADGLNRFALIEPGARLDVTTAGIVNSVNFDFSGRNITPGFEALAGATLNLDRVVIDKAYGLTSLPGGIVAGTDATINVSSSTIRDSSSGPAVILAGGTANVVSSVLDGSGGVTVTGGSSVATGTVNFVNSVAFLAGPLNGGGNDSLDDNRFAAGTGGTINATASTIVADLVSLSGSPSAGNGVPLDAAGGTIELRSSAVMVTNDADEFPGQIGYRTSAGGALTADAYSWVRPTLAQTALQLPTLFSQPALITGEPGFLVDTISVSPLIEETFPFPVASWPVWNGVLIGVVPDADSANVLINPITTSIITLDVFGQARTTGGLRNAGAVEGFRSVPELDPASLGGGLSLLLGALACLENRRRLRR